MFASKVIVSVLGLCIFLANPEFINGKIYRSHACEGHHLYLSCYIGDVIRVLDAGYGRRNETICFYFDEPQPDFKVCQSPYAPDIIKAYCDGHRTCSIKAKNSNFQDPCPGQVKYAEAIYTCVSKSKSHQFSGKFEHLNLIKP